MSAVLKHIAAIAKGLNKAELHVLIELASRAETAGVCDVTGSSRELADQTGLVRASVQSAIHSLNKKGLVWSDAGAATRPASHRLLFLDAVENQVVGPIIWIGTAQSLSHGGLNSEPVVAQNMGQGGPTVRPVEPQVLSRSGLKTRPGVAQISSQGGLTSGPVLNDESMICKPPNTENASAPAGSIGSDFDNLIDRLQKSKKSDFDEHVFEEARKLIASHHAKFAREGFQITGMPDDQITAQFLAIAEWPRLSHMLWDLMSERKASGYSYGWYVTVALQRIHGIPPGQVRNLRAKLRHSSPTSIPDVDGPPMLPRREFENSQRKLSRPAHAVGLPGRNFDQQIRALAAIKAIR